MQQVLPGRRPSCEDVAFHCEDACSADSTLTTRRTKQTRNSAPAVQASSNNLHTTPTTSPTTFQPLLLLLLQRLLLPRESLHNLTSPNQSSFHALLWRDRTHPNTSLLGPLLHRRKAHVFLHLGRDVQSELDSRSSFNAREPGCESGEVVDRDSRPVVDADPGEPKS